ncbi:MAG: DedA family protein [Actinomycetota bacterium]|nr:DedA family protein [Actinomycetota bacterium]
MIAELVQTLEEWILAMAESFWVFPALYGFATIDGFFPPIPSESVVIALGSLNRSAGVPNLALVLLFAALGAFTGDQIAYQIGKKINVRHLRFMRSARAQAALDWAEHSLERRGASFIIAARYVPIGRVAVNMTAGTVGFHRPRFMALTGIAAVTWACYSTLIGIASGSLLEGRPVLAIIVGVIGGVILGVIVDRVIHWLTSRSATTDDDGERSAPDIGSPDSAVEGSPAP